MTTKTIAICSALTISVAAACGGDDSSSSGGKGGTPGAGGSAAGSGGAAGTAAAGGSAGSVSVGGTSGSGGSTSTGGTSGSGGDGGASGSGGTAGSGPDGGSGAGGMDASAGAGGSAGSSGSGGGAGAGGSSGSGGSAGSGGAGGGDGGTGGPCTPGQRRCTVGNGVEICNSSGTGWLLLETCAVSCSAGLCTGPCTPGERRCNGNAVEECNGGGSAWTNVESCSTFCDPASAQCALSALDVTGNMDLDGVVVVDGPVIVRSGATLTSPAGDLTLRATSITVELGGSIVAAPTGMTAAGAGGNGTVCNFTRRGGGGGGYGTSGGSASCISNPGSAHGLTNDFVVTAGSPGGTGYDPTGGGGMGGHGGGVLRLIASTIDIAGQVTANGENGALGNPSFHGGGGGGSGGGVLIAGDSVTVTGAVSAAGGSGVGSGSQKGGDGGQGRVKILYGGMDSLTGSITGVSTQGLLPPLTIASSTHPSSTLTYNDDFASVNLAWERPFPSAIGYYQLTNTTNSTVPTPGNGLFVATESLSIPRTEFAAGDNFFHIAVVDAMSAVGTVQGWYRVKVNTTPPTVTSSSHPSQTTWSTNPNAFFAWTFPVPDASLQGAYYVLDEFASTVPTAADTFVPVTQKQVLLSALPDGLWFFHLVSSDQQGYLTKQAEHYQIRLGPDPGTGGLLGQVVDGGSQPVDGATVTINRGLFTDTTNATGNYNFLSVIAGSWEVSVSKDGFNTATKMVTINSGASTTENFVLN